MKSNAKIKFGKVLICLLAALLIISVTMVFLVNLNDSDKNSQNIKRSQIVDIILFSGQSNMVGYGEVPSSYKVNGDDGFEYLNENNSVIDIDDPVGERIGIDANQSYKGSMIPSFVFHYLEKTDNRVMVVHSAYGASSIERWQPGGKFLNDTITKYNNAVRYIENDDKYEVGKKIYVWMQGEADIKKGTSKEDYESMFIALHESIIESTGINECIMIPVGSRPYVPEENIKTIIDAQHELIEKNDDIYLGSDSAYKCSLDDSMLKDDNLHFNTRALELFGKESVQNYFKDVYSGRE